MRQQLAWLLTIRHPDDDVRRRGANFVALALMLIIIAPIIGLAWLWLGHYPSVVACVITMVVCAAGIAMARRGQIGVAAWALIVMLIVADVAVIGLAGEVSNTPFFLLLPIVVAGLLLPPSQVALVCMIAGLALAGALMSLPRELFVLQVVREDVQDSASLLLFGALTSLLGAVSARLSLRAAQHAQAAAEQSSAQLERANSLLEARVAERTAALEQSLVAQQAQAAELRDSLARQQSLNELVSALSLPIIPVRSNVLVAPLVGNLDSLRAQQLIDEVLQQIELRRARAIILDITGVAIVDTQLAHTLLRTADAARLLGAQTVLVGIRPEVAQTLVGLGADLGRLSTAATLQDGLAVVGG